MTTDPSSDVVERLLLTPDCEVRALSDLCVEAANIIRARDATIERLSAELERVKGALTPSSETKAEYIGEFCFTIDEQSDDAMCEVTRTVDVPWATIKEIMAAIRQFAALSNTADTRA